MKLQSSSLIYRIIAPLLVFLILLTSAKVAFFSMVESYDLMLTDGILSRPALEIPGLIFKRVACFSSFCCYLFYAFITCLLTISLSSEGALLCAS
jgi:hypothetical protein